MPNLLTAAENYLDRAELSLRDGAPSLFWDAVERSMATLADVSEAADRTTADAHQYMDTRQKVHFDTPEFAVSTNAIEVLSNVAASTGQRMDSMVRFAHRQSTFASIYEARRTNQILVAGFTSLAEGLADMTDQVTRSVDSLRSSVESMAHRIQASSEFGIAAADQRHREVMAAEQQHRSTERRAVDMLDNIQRGRQPLF